MTVRRIQPDASAKSTSQTRPTHRWANSRDEEESDTSAQDAWGAVFRLRQVLVDGVNVNAFLSKNISPTRTGWDGLLWNYGMHHFHLGPETDKHGFRDNALSHLLFAISYPYGCVLRGRQGGTQSPKDGIGWVSQELLRIVHSSWPNLIEANVLHGVSGDELTDEEMQELRRKNMNYAMNIHGKAIAPLRGGMASDGSSVLCTLSAISFLKELRYHEEVLRNEEVRQAVAEDLRGKGHDVEPHARIRTDDP